MRQHYMLLPVGALLCLLVSPLLAAQDQTIWSIGKFDCSSSEFAQNWFANSPDRQVSFDIGKSIVSRDWPSIQPAEYDPTAGAKLHPYTINFDLKNHPSGSYDLIIHAFFDAAYVPKLRIEVNGHVGNFLFHPKPISLQSKYWEQAINHLVLATDTLTADIPASYLEGGHNTIILTAYNGTHFQYDDIEFVRRRSGLQLISDIRLRPTVLYKSSAGTPELSFIDIRMAHIPFDIRVQLQIGKYTEREIARKTNQEFGDVHLPFYVPLTASTQTAKISVSVGNVHKTFHALFQPAKKWTVYAAPSVHDDVGYRETQPITREWQDRIIDDAITLEDKYPWYKFNIEDAWTASDYLRHRSAEQGRKFLQLARNDRIGINAFHSDVETNALSPAEMLHEFTLAAKFRKDGVPMHTAAQGDVPSYTGALPSYLSSAGVDFFVGGSDQIRAPLFRNAAYSGKEPLNLQSPFFWEGPDGKRVLAWIAVIYAQMGRIIWGYPRHDGEFAQLSRDPSEDLEVLRSSLPLFLLNYTRDDYPYDAVLLYGLYGDDHPLGDGEAPIIERWNKEYAYPKFVVATLSDFSKHILDLYSDRIPILKGDMGAYWGDGYGTAAEVTKWNREAQATITAAGKFATISSLLDPNLAFPASEYSNAWEKLLEADEHTWGDEDTLSDPNSERVLQEAKWKSNMAHDAILRSRWILQRSLEQLRATLRIPQLSVVVFNQHSWPQSGPVDVDLPIGWQLEDPATGAIVPYAICGHGETRERVRFWANDVPALGLRVYSIVAATPEQPLPDSNVPEASSYGVMKNSDLHVDGKYYSLSLDRSSGAIKSLIDKQTGRELVDPASPYGLNQYLSVDGGGGTSVLNWQGPPPLPGQLHISTASATSIKIERTAWGNRVLLQAQTSPVSSVFSITSEIDIFDEEPRIDFINQLDKKTKYQKESSYFAFPFALKDATIKYQLATGWFQPNLDQLPGAAKEWYLLQHGVQIVDSSNSIVWATEDAPLVTFGDIVRGTWPADLTLNKRWLFSWPLNNYWYTNFPASQEGHFLFRYSLTSAPQIDNAGASQFGIDVKEPLIALTSTPEGNRITPPFGSSASSHVHQASFLQGLPRNVALISLEQSESDHGVIVALRELGGHETSFTFNIPGVMIDRASACEEMGRCQQSLGVENNTISVSIPANGVTLVKLNGSSE